MKFSNGDKVKDKVTSLQGIVVVTSVHLNGCIRYGVQPQELKDGKPVDSQWYDENDLTLVKAGVVEGIPLRKTGGPQRGESKGTR